MKEIINKMLKQGAFKEICIQTRNIRGLIFVLVFFSLGLLVFANCYKGLTEKQSYTYHVEALNYEHDKISCLEEKSFYITVVSKNTKRISLNGCVFGDLSKIKLFLKKEDSDSVFSLDRVYSEGDVVYISVDDFDLSKGRYLIIIKNNSDSDVLVSIDEENTLNNTQIIEFVYNNEAVLFILIGWCIIAFVGGGCYLLLKNRDESFLILSVIVGLVFVIIIPPYTAPDELRHFSRAYDIADGNFVCTNYYASDEYDGQLFPVCDLPEELFRLKLLSEQNAIYYANETNSKIAIDVYFDEFINFFSGKQNKTPIFGDYTTSSIAFFPQAMGIVCGKVVRCMPIIMFYMSRFFNIIMASILTYLGFKIIPKYKKIYILKSHHFIPRIMSGQVLP